MASVSAIVPAVAGDLGVSDFVAGRINWAYMLPYGVCALFYGPLTRRFDNKHIAVASLFLFSLFSFLSGIAADFRTLFVARFLVGIVASATTPLVLIYIADHAQEAGRGRSVGLFFSATFTADLAGLFLSGLVPWRVMFFIPAVLGVATALLTARYFPRTLAGKGLIESRYREAFRQPEILRAFAYIFIISMLYHGVRQWLGVYFAQDLGASQFVISLTLVWASLAGIFGEAFGGSFSDKKGRIPTLKIGVSLMALSVFLLVFAKASINLPLLMLLWGFGWTMNHAGMSAFLTDLNKRFMKEISSLNSSVRFVAGGLGVVVGGWLMQAGFKTGFVVYGLLLSGLLFLTGRILKPERGRACQS